MAGHKWRWAFTKDSELCSSDFGREQDRQDNLNGFKNNVVKCSVDQTWEDVIRKSARQVKLKYPKLKLSKLSGVVGSLGLLVNQCPTEVLFLVKLHEAR